MHIQETQTQNSRTFLVFPLSKRGTHPQNASPPTCPVWGECLDWRRYPLSDSWRSEAQLIHGEDGYSEAAIRRTEDESYPQHHRDGEGNAEELWRPLCSLQLPGCRVHQWYTASLIDKYIWQRTCLAKSPSRQHQVDDKWETLPVPSCVPLNPLPVGAQRESWQTVADFSFF